MFNNKVYSNWVLVRIWKFPSSRINKRYITWDFRGSSFHNLWINKKSMWSDAPSTCCYATMLANTRHHIYMQTQQSNLIIKWDKAKFQCRLDIKINSVLYTRLYKQFSHDNQWAVFTYFIHNMQFQNILVNWMNMMTLYQQINWITSLD